MARVIYGGGVTEFVGSIGGTTYQSNGSGFIARVLPKIRKSRTYSQVNQLSQFSYISQLYRNLSGADKADWDAFALANNHVNYWNETKITNGLGWFIVINSLRLAAGDSVTNVSNGNVLPSTIPTCSVTITATEVLLDCATPIGAAGEALYIWATSELPNNTYLPRKALRLIKVTNADSLLPIDLASDWVNVFGGTVTDKLFTPSNSLILALTKIKTPDYVPLPYSFVRS